MKRRTTVTENIRKNDILTIDIIDMNNLGAGVGKTALGAVVFVVGAVTGDRVECKIIKVAKDYLVAIIADIIEPSSYRAEPTCPSFKRCGGCVYSHKTFEYENITVTISRMVKHRIMQLTLQVHEESDVKGGERV